MLRMVAWVSVLMRVSQSVEPHQGAIIAGLGWKFWRGRKDITLLIIGVVQALFGIIVYINRFSVHG